MIEKYNAFISYRHATEDSKIASEIQTQLERFRIPKEIRKMTGVGRFERIFRDKEELPITSDLNDDIDRALAESDNLIVICSVRTGESIWVKKEIETFLKTHDKKHVFTVLVDGEPGDVIPEELLHDTVTRVLPDGTTETREEMIEPLSCDYRIGIKQARKVELPRLAASLLGCSYDELVRRRRQYQRRRIAALGSVAAIMAAGAVGYLSWSLIQIQKNYNLAEFNSRLAQENYALAQANYETAQSNYLESLSNQSRYLASESGDLLRAGDRIGAVQLALAALPSEGNDRPVITEAEFALASALGAYSSPEDGAVDPVWKYSTGHEIKRFVLDYERKYLAIVDHEGNLCIWNMPERSILKSFGADESMCRDCIFDDKGRLAVCFDDRIVLYDSDLETAIWSYTLDESWSGSNLERKLMITGDYSEIIYGASKGFLIFDEGTGELKEQHIYNDEIPVEREWYESVSVVDLYVSPDGRYIEAEILSMLENKPVYFLNRETGVWTATEMNFGNPVVSRYFDGFGVLVTYEDDMYTSSLSLGTSQLLKEKYRNAVMIDPDTGKVLWHCGAPHSLVGRSDEVVSADVVNDDGETVKAAIILFSNKCVFADAATGDIIAVRELPAAFVDAYLNTSGKKLITLLRDGSYVSIRLDDPHGMMSSIPLFAPDVDGTDIYTSDEGYNCFLIEYEDRYVIEYDSVFCDRDRKAAESVPGDVSVYSSGRSGDRVLILGGDMNLYCLEADGTLAWKQHLEGDFPFDVSLLGAAENGDFYLTNSNAFEGESLYGDRVFCVDVETGNMERITELDSGNSDSTCLVNGIIYQFRNEVSAGCYLMSYDPSSGETKRIEPDEGFMPDAFRPSFAVSPDGRYCAVYETKSGLSLINMEDGSFKEVCPSGDMSVSWHPDSDKFVVCTINSVTVYDTSGSELLSVRTADNEAVDAMLADDVLLVVYSSGVMVKYNASGEMISSIDVELLELTEARNIDFELYGNELFLVVDAGVSGSAVNIINLDDFRLRNFIMGYLEYDPKNERFFTRSVNPPTAQFPVGVFDRKKTEDLIAMGNEFLRGEVMSDEMAMRYGI